MRCFTKPCWSPSFSRVLGLSAHTCRPHSAVSAEDHLTPLTFSQRVPEPDRHTCGKDGGKRRVT
ncbi:hypothetical protein E2C01_026175 [Portunus trituberculatus]|uniref:Uncharacterized protein n=1 Tax=Portunus trituberculatus TaxID=210409 RepID=A0A5B7EJZ9_PORTR|nr:hypothetical protein [Portunus trituberculatus]